MINVTAYQIDALKELVNIGVGRAAGALNQMLNAHVGLRVPYIKLFLPQELKDGGIAEFGAGKLSAVRLKFKGPFSGNASLVFPPDSASKFVSVITNEESGVIDLDELRIGALTEVGNIVLNGVMGTIGNVLEQHINYSLPTYVEDTVIDLLTLDVTGPDATIMLAQAHFTVAEFQIEGDIILLFELGSFDTLLAAIGNISPR